MLNAKSILKLVSLSLLVGCLFAEDSPPKKLKPADEADAGKRIIAILAVDGRINQLVAEVRQLQEQQAGNKKQFEEWQALKRKEYSVTAEQTINLDLQWTQPVKAPAEPEPKKTAAVPENKKLAKSATDSR